MIVSQNAKYAHLEKYLKAEAPISGLKFFKFLTIFRYAFMTMSSFKWCSYPQKHLECSRCRGMLKIINASLSCMTLSSTFSADSLHFAISAANSSLSRYMFLSGESYFRCDSLRFMTIFLRCFYESCRFMTIFLRGFLGLISVLLVSILLLSIVILTSFIKLF